MKIAQVTLYYKPFMLGGVEWYVYNISRELVKKGHEVEVVTASSCGGEKAPSEEVIEGVRVRRVGLKLDWSYRMKVWDGLSDVLESGGYDIIHGYDYAAPHSLAAVRAARRTHAGSALTVFDVHGMIPRRFFKRIPMKVVEGYYARRTFPDADSIMTRAKELVPALVRMGADERKITVTPSGVRDESLGSYDGAVFRARYGVNGSPVILCLGRLNSLKGPQFLVEAAPAILRQFPEARIVFVGPDQVGYQSTLEARAGELGVRDRLSFTGPIYGLTEKMQAYAACDLFVLPTSYEGTSQAIFEAMAQGKPVVASNVGGIPSQVEPGVDGMLVQYGNVGELERTVSGLLSDRALMARMGASARVKAKDYSYSKLAEQMDRLYAEIGRN